MLSKVTERRVGRSLVSRLDRGQERLFRGPPNPDQIEGLLSTNGPKLPTPSPVHSPGRGILTPVSVESHISSPNVHIRDVSLEDLTI